MLSSENGILARSGKSSVEYEKVSFKERLQMEVLGNYDNDIKLNPVALKENIEKNLNNSNVINTELPLLVKNIKLNSLYLIDTDGTVMLYDENAVARIKDKFYATLQDAINAVPTDNTKKEIFLLKDDVENVNIPENTNIVLNLNNKTLSCQDKTTINARGNLVIKNGTINSSEKLALNNYGCTIISEDNTFLTSSSSNFYVIANYPNAKLTILGGRFEAKNAGVLYNYDAGEVVIDGINTHINTLSGNTINNLGKMIIQNGLIESKDNSAIYNQKNGEIKINGGIINSNFNSDWNGIVRQNSTGSITIGNVGDDNNKIIINSNNNYNINGIFSNADLIGTTITINSGTINGYNGLNIASKDTNIYLNGGIINAENSNGYSVKLYNSLENTVLYLKKNVVSLNGHGKTGKESINNQAYIIEMD